MIVGSGKYDTLEIMRDSLAASGAKVVTVAVRLKGDAARNNTQHDLGVCWLDRRCQRIRAAGPQVRGNLEIAHG